MGLAFLTGFGLIFLNFLLLDSSWLILWYVLAQKWPGIWAHFPVRGPGGGIRVHYSAQIAVEERSRDPDYVLDIRSLFCDRGI